jgi:hypothetical protein
MRRRGRLKRPVLGVAPGFVFLWSAVSLLSLTTGSDLPFSGWRQGYFISGLSLCVFALRD